MTKKCYAISHNKKFLACLQNVDDKDYVEIFDLINLDSVTLFEIDVKNGNEITFGESDLFVIVKDSYKEGQIVVYLWDGLKIEVFDKKKIPFFISEVFYSEKRKKMILFTVEEEIVIINLTILQKIKNFQVMKEIKSARYCDFIEESEKTDLRNPLAKKRFMNSKNKSFFDDAKHFGNIKQLRISFNENFFAFSSKEETLRNFLFIYDLRNFQITSVIKFMEKIENFKWTKNEELIVITGNMCFYNWNTTGIHIMEFFYKNEFFARKLKIFNLRNFWFFYDSKRLILKVYNPNKELPNFKKENFVVENEDHFI